MGKQLMRAIAWWKAMPKWMMRDFPEQSFFIVTFFIPGLALAAYRMSVAWDDIRPFYRQHYQIQRPTAKRLLYLREPNEYPPKYIVNDGR